MDQEQAERDVAYLNSVLMSPVDENGNLVAKQEKSGPDPSVDELLYSSFSEEQPAQEEPQQQEAPAETAVTAEQVAEEALKESEPSEDEDDDEDSEDLGNLGKRAQKRIRQLVKGKKELAAQLQQTQSAVEQRLQQQQQQFQLWAQGLQQQNQYLQQQMLGLQQNKQALEDKNLSPLEKWERDIMSKAEAQLQRRLGETQKQYETRIAKLEQRLEQERQEKEREFRKQFYTSETEKARKKTFKDLPAEVQEKLSRPLDNLTITYGAAFNLEPHQAAPEVKQMLDEYFNARLQAMNAKAKATVGANKDKPKAPSAPRVAGKELDTGSQFTRDQIRKAGYRDRLEAWADGFRQIKRSA